MRQQAASAEQVAEVYAFATTEIGTRAESIIADERQHSQGWENIAHQEANLFGSAVNECMSLSTGFASEHSESVRQRNHLRQELTECTTALQNGHVHVQQATIAKQELHNLQTALPQYEQQYNKMYAELKERNAQLTLRTRELGIQEQGAEQLHAQATTMQRQLTEQNHELTESRQQLSGVRRELHAAQLRNLAPPIPLNPPKCPDCEFVQKELFSEVAALSEFRASEQDLADRINETCEKRAEDQLTQQLSAYQLLLDQCRNKDQTIANLHHEGKVFRNQIDELQDFISVGEGADDSSRLRLELVKAKQELEAFERDEAQWKDDQCWYENEMFAYEKRLMAARSENDELHVSKGASSSSSGAAPRAAQGKDSPRRDSSAKEDMEARLNRRIDQMADLMATLAEAVKPEVVVGTVAPKAARRATIAGEDSDDEVAAEGEVRVTVGRSPAKPPKVKVVATNLLVGAPKGATKLEVESVSGFHMGDKIRIGNDVFEERTIVGFSSLVVDVPLRADHDAGEPVVLIEAASRIPSLHLSAASDAAGGADAEDSEASVGVKVGGSGANRKITAPTLPKYRSEMRGYHMELIQNVMATSTRRDNKEKEFLDAVLKMDKEAPELDVVPAKHVLLDRALMPSLEKSCKKEVELADEIHRYKLLLQGKPGAPMITSRKILAMIYGYLATDDNLMEVVDIRALSNLMWEAYGDENAAKFYADWLDKSTRLDLDLSDGHKRDLLWAQMKKSEALKVPLLKFKDIPREERTHQQLLDIFKKWLSEKREDNNYAKETANALKDGQGKPKTQTQADPAQQQQQTGTAGGLAGPKGPGKGKGRGAGQHGQPVAQPPQHRPSIW